MNVVVTNILPVLVFRASETVFKNPKQITNIVYKMLVLCCELFESLTQVHEKLKTALTSYSRLRSEIHRIVIHTPRFPVLRHPSRRCPPFVETFSSTPVFKTSDHEERKNKMQISSTIAKKLINISRFPRVCCMARFLSIL